MSYGLNAVMQICFYEFKVFSPQCALIKLTLFMTSDRREFKEKKTPKSLLFMRQLLNVTFSKLVS